MSKPTIWEPCTRKLTFSNKIIFNLKKKKAIEDKKNYNEERQHRQKQTFTVINSVENFYKDRINLLKERLAQEKVNRKESE